MRPTVADLALGAALAIIGLLIVVGAAWIRSVLGTGMAVATAQAFGLGMFVAGALDVLLITIRAAVRGGK